MQIPAFLRQPSNLLGVGALIGTIAYTVLSHIPGINPEVLHLLSVAIGLAPVFVINDASVAAVVKLVGDATDAVVTDTVAAKAPLLLDDALDVYDKVDAYVKARAAAVTASPAAQGAGVDHRNRSRRRRDWFGFHGGHPSCDVVPLAPATSS